VVFLFLPGIGEWWIILIAILLLFGATAIPKLARSLGKAQGEFLRAKKEFDSEVRKGRAESDPAEEERRIRDAAKDLGIEEEGKDLAEVKRLLNERLA
jgi:sec-independent protein translocase protein TatA